VRQLSGKSKASTTGSTNPTALKPKPLRAKALHISQV